jgi:aspartate/methionine/tyrosine aminotransferase
MFLGDLALSHEKRVTLLDRQRGISRVGHDTLTEWLAEQDGLFSVARRQATSIGFMRYHVDAPSLDVAERIRTEASVLTAPGVFLGAEGHLRITVGYEPEKHPSGARPHRGRRARHGVTPGGRWPPGRAVAHPGRGRATATPRVAQ